MTVVDMPPSPGGEKPEEGFDPASLESYAWVYKEKIRYNDLDPLGHVTSQSFVNFFETARVLFFLEAGHPVDDPDVGLDDRAPGYQLPRPASLSG